LVLAYFSRGFTKIKSGDSLGGFLDFKKGAEKIPPSQQEIYKDIIEESGKEVLRFYDLWKLLFGKN